MLHFSRVDTVPTNEGPPRLESLSDIYEIQDAYLLVLQNVPCQIKPLQYMSGFSCFAKFMQVGNHSLFLFFCF